MSGPPGVAGGRGVMVAVVVRTGRGGGTGRGTGFGAGRPTGAVGIGEWPAGVIVIGRCPS
ncbi:hypothetical protein GCM10010422_56810 [Streptomyces graminearus]|uniref:Uncharacterized protein n=1 Tax=Streptomyces graminearus TaxID=284030 RepID=A0ABN3MED9_9ACTN